LSRLFLLGFEFAGLNGASGADADTVQRQIQRKGG
jgi:hypothetical protein